MATRIGGRCAGRAACDAPDFARDVSDGVAGGVADEPHCGAPGLAADVARRAPRIRGTAPRVGRRARLGRLAAPDRSVLGGSTWFGSLPDAAIATGRPASAFAVCWYAMLLCWVGARSADVRALGLRPRPLYGAMGALALAALTLAFVPAGRSSALEISLLDVEAGAAFVRAPSGQTAVLLTADDAFGLTPSSGPAASGRR